MSSHASKNTRPTKCCAMGSYDCQVPMPIAARVRNIDYCLADIVAALVAANIETVASCCGHDKTTASILLGDGREIIVKGVVRPWEKLK